MKLLTGSLLLGIIVFPSVSSGEWVTESVLPAQMVYSTSLSLGSGNNPVIAFCEDGSLRLAFWKDSFWEIVDVLPDDDIRICSLELGSTGAPEIAYWRISDYTIHYIFWDGTSWIDTLIAGGEGGMAGPDCSLCIDSQGNPMISYLFHSSDSPLCFAQRVGSDWIHSTIDPSLSAVLNVSMDLGVDDTPHVAYFDQANYDLRYAVRGERFWNVQTVDSEGNVGYDAHIAVDSRNLPHISYMDRTIGALKYAHYNGEEWEICIVDSTGDPTGVVETSIRLDSNDLPRILYGVLVGTQMRCAIYDGSSWAIEPVDGRGHSSSLVLDSDDQPHAAYFRYSYNAQGLMYAHGDSTDSDK